MRIALIPCLLLVGTFFVCSACNSSTDHKLASEQPKAIAVALKTDGLAIGDIAPDFNLENIDGTFFSLADIKDANGHTPKGYIVTFTCNTCPFAVKYEERLIKLHHRMAAKGYPVVAIQPNDPVRQPGDSMAKMKARANTKDYPFVYLLDDGQEIYPQYGAGRTPEIFLLDADRRLQYHGAIDNNAQNPAEVSINYVENAIEAIENGEVPNPTEVKAIGCSIKGQRS